VDDVRARRRHEWLRVQVSGGCSAAVPTAYLNRFAWTPIFRLQVVATTASPDDPSLTTETSGAVVSALTRHSNAAAGSAEGRCCTPTVCPKARACGNNGSRPTARRSANARWWSGESARRMTASHTRSTRLLAPRSRPDPFDACSSRLPGKRPRPVLEAAAQQCRAYPTNACARTSPPTCCNTATTDPSAHWRRTTAAG
jgi:hypothetical protein